MKKHTSVFLHLLLVIGLMSWPGCDDTTTTTDNCSFDVPSLGFSDYCSPYFQDFRNIANPQPSTIENLPAGCAPNYDYTRVFTMDVPPNKEIFLHRYRNFPGNIYVEVFGVDCDSAEKQLIDCVSSDAVVAVHRVDIPNYTKIIIRVVTIQNSEYVPGSREEDEINIAAFGNPPAQQWVNQGTAAAFTRDCNGRPNRLILSPGPNNDDVIGSAEKLGLNYRSCNCDENLVAVEVPPGVSLDKLKPKVPKAEAEPDTTSTGFDIFIEIPVVNPTSFNLDPNDDPFIADNPCLDFRVPETNTGDNNRLKVAIIDSGVDYNAHSIFNDFASSNASSCIPEGPLGYDFVNNDAEPLDDIGHGTSVASAFLSGLQLSSNLSLSHYKFIGAGGGSLFDALCATSTAIKNGNHLINCSWGFEYNGLPAALAHVLNNARASKIVVVVSAGNNGQDVMNMNTGKQYFPAAAAGFGDYSNLISVGSFRQLDINNISRIPFSNYNQQVVDLTAIYATKCLQRGGGSNFAAGTSISAPIVANEIAEVITTNNLYGNAPSAIESFRNSRTSSNTAALPNIRDGRFLPLPSVENDCGTPQ